MQTFLPYPDYQASARVLDPSRLGNQAYREGKTLLKGGWKHHPASKMWRGFERSLADYLLALFEELSERELFYPDHIAEVREIRSTLPDTGVPPWLGNDLVHSSHRAALLGKNPEWYSQFGWKEKPLGRDASGKLLYVWPVLIRRFKRS